jgi:hypothetical protein
MPTPVDDVKRRHCQGCGRIDAFAFIETRLAEHVLLLCPWCHDKALAIVDHMADARLHTPGPRTGEPAPTADASWAVALGDGQPKRGVSWRRPRETPPCEPGSVKFRTGSEGKQLARPRRADGRVFRSSTL